MMDKNKTKAQLISELEELRTRVASFEASRLERDRDKREVGEAEEIYRSLVDLSPDPVVILQGDRFQFVSKAFTEVFGYTQEDTDGGMSFYELVQEDDKESVRQQYEDRLAGKQVTRTYRIDLITKEGMVVPCETSARLIQYNGEPADLVLIRDISERERIAEILRKSEESYRAVVEDQEELICRFLPGGILTFVNEAYCRYFDKKREDLIGRSFMSLIPVSDQQKINAHLDSLGPANPVLTHEHRVVGQNGEIRWQQWTNRAILDEKGLIKEFQSVGRDITARVRGEKALQKAHNELERRIQDRTHELQDANNELRKEIKNRERVEETLRESERKYRDLVDSSIVGIYRSNLAGDILYVNEALARMMEFDSPEEMKPEGVFARYKNKKDREQLLKILKKSGRIENSEHELLTRRGEIRKVLLSAVLDGGVLSGMIMDITKRKLAEEALRESEERFRELADLLPQPVFELNLEGNFTYGNRCGFEAFGYNQDDLDKGLNALEVFIPEERERVQKNIRKRLAGEEFEDHEYIGLRKDGSTFPVLIYSAPIIKKDQPVGVRGIVLDITERKTFEEALRKSEERHRLFLQASPDPIVVYDIEGKATYINPAFEQVFGWPSEELLDRRIDFVPEENWPETEAAIERMLLGESILGFETRRLTKDGRILNIQLSSSLFHDRDGKPEGNIVILRDVTKQRLAAEALRESEENFKALAENANDGILIAVGEGTHVYANSRASEITGYSIDELQEITLHEFTAPEEVEKVADKFSRRLAGENVQGQYETLLVRKSGEIFPAELSSGRSFWEGQPASIVIFRDITDRKQAEKALRKREAELEIRASELEELNAALRVLLKKREEDQKELEEKVLSNVKELVLPYVERLKKGALGVKRDTYLNILQSNLENIVSPFVRKLSSTYLGLTPTEIHVANLVKEARDTKTIAQLLNMSPRTVETHRQNIRKKLGLKNKKANLRTHLLSMQ